MKNDSCCLLLFLISPFHSHTNFGHPCATLPKLHSLPPLLKLSELVQNDEPENCALVAFAPCTPAALLTITGLLLTDVRPDTEKDAAAVRVKRK